MVLCQISTLPIIGQLCPRPAAGATPVVRTKRCGEKRPKQQQLVVEDQKPRNKSILDIIKWIDETGELKKTNANSLEFCSKLWSELSEKEYPNPAKAGRVLPDEASTDIQEG